MLARLLCAAGMHLWEEDETTTKEPIASDDGLLMVKVVEKKQRFCATCNKQGGSKVVERYEIFDDYYNGED